MMSSRDCASAQVQSALNRELELRSVLFRTLSEGIIVLDHAGVIIDINGAAAAFLQCPVEELLGSPFAQVCDFFRELTKTPIEDPMATLLLTASRHPEDFWILKTQRGTEMTVHLSASTLDLDAPETVIILQDVTTNRRLRRQLQWQAHHDPITGLVNRIYFEEVLSHILSQDFREPPSYVLAQLDIDHFKLINDTCGNAAGDQLLGQLATLVQDQIRSVDLLARLGGDEFGILFRQCSLSEAHQIASQLLDVLNTYRYVWKDRSLAIGMSIGIVPLDSETTDAETALSKVDTACYTAKNRGKRRIQVFSSRDVEVEDLKRHQEWSFLIRDAIDDGRFTLYRQPIVAIDQLAAPPHHYEVLLRMVTEDGEIIVPNRFIPTAERYHLMPMIDRWVVNQSLTQLQTVLASSPLSSPQSFYAINLSGDSLNDDQFLQALMDQVETGYVSPQHICFEITETAAIANISQVQIFMQALKQMGCLFSLDDFGTGMSSFGYLSTLPVDFVKIDGKFVQDIELDQSNATIVESIVHVSKSLGLKTIAERVENPSVAHRLDALGVDYVQGFGVGYPEPWIL